MENGRRYPDVYLMSRFPDLDKELRNFLPKEANLVVVPITDKRIKWDKSIQLSSEEIETVQKAEVLVIDSSRLAKLLYQLPNAKWVQATWAGVEMIFEEVEKSKPFPNFKLTRFGDSYFGELMSNYVIAQIINIERGFYLYSHKQKTNEWARPFFPNFRVLSDLTIGVLGSGNLGSAVGRMLKRNGSRVIAYVRTVRKSSTDSYDEATTDLNRVLEEVDYLCNVLPSTDETRGLLDGAVLKNCRKKPVFINIGRGDIINENNIIKALKEGWISKAILDVFETEPLPASSPLWQTPEVYITPHVGAIPRIDGIAKFIAQNYVRYVNGEPLMNHIEWNKGY